ncbi:MAG: DNA ligase [Paraglaciecola sp.]|uniref:DNA ligase n=1 Tax=Paraglaciecola sp. TaxID=1920173 RepID=UPI003296CE6C
MDTTISRLALVISHLAFVIFFTVSVFSSEKQPNTTANATNHLKQQLATSYHNDIVVKHYWISEKLDGIRARWNGSALVTRNNNVIHSPTWFTKDFPSQVIDGELWLARDSFEKTASIVLRDAPTDDWKNIKFMLFDLPEHSGTFTQRLTALYAVADTIASPNVKVIPQFKLDTHQQLTDKLDFLVANGAEGLMLHHQKAYYEDGRSNSLLKLKKHQDAEATVIAHLPGKGKYQGLLGSMLVELDSGIQFKIGSGFSDIQRQNPPPVDSVITFKYYGLTAKGIPRFASFLRVKPAMNPQSQ